MPQSSAEQTTDLARKQKVNRVFQVLHFSAWMPLFAREGMALARIGIKSRRAKGPVAFKVSRFARRPLQRLLSVEGFHVPWDLSGRDPHRTSDKQAMKLQPLTDTELDNVTDVLKRFGDKRAMNLEMMDGFFAALICGPETVLPSEYLPQIWGGQMVNEAEFETKPILQEFLSLIMRHWNATCETLQSGDVFLPLLLDDENGIARANDWANAFVRGMKMRRDSWSVLMDDEEHGGSLIPILALAHEHDPDPEMRPYKEPISAEMRERLIASAAAGVMAIYNYFEAERILSAHARASTGTFRRNAPKVGRNDPCPCGSGKKFKHCCGQTTFH